MKSIDIAKPTVMELFANKQYNIDYYQREYRWERKQVAQLLNDLFDAFLESWNIEDPRQAVLGYEGYFLGPVILTTRGFATDIVDGQQRLTTLALLLLALRRRRDAVDERQQNTLASLVTTTVLDEQTFTLAVEERRRCMEAIFAGEEHTVESSELSIRNLVERFGDIEEILEDGIESVALPHFADWLMRRVQMVSVMATTDADAYTIFETMNDRGLRLTLPEMLRGYLLSRIESESKRSAASDIWKKRIAELTEFGKEADVDAIQAWLRGRHAVSASQYRSGVEPGDYERIGNEFHRWVRDVERTCLSLRGPSDFDSFITQDFSFYATQYARLLRAANGNESDLETVQYIASQGFTLHYMVLLSAVTPADSEDEVLRKMRAAAAFVDILIHRRLWNSMRISQTSLRYPLFDLAKSLREAESVEEVVDLLTSAAAADNRSFAPEWRFRRNRRNSNIVRRILARLTLHVERGSVRRLRYRDLVETGSEGYDIEHVIPNVYSRYRRQWPDQTLFEDERSWIGGLLLIPSRENRAIGKLTYEQKLPQYLKHNQLAASLNPAAYERDPAFCSFREDSKLLLKPCREFGKRELHERQRLYEQIAGQVWSPERIRDAAGL